MTTQPVVPIVSLVLLEVRDFWFSRQWCRRILPWEFLGNILTNLSPLSYRCESHVTNNDERLCDHFKNYDIKSMRPRIDFLMSNNCSSKIRNVADQHFMVVLEEIWNSD